MMIYSYENSNRQTKIQWVITDGQKERQTYKLQRSDVCGLLLKLPQSTSYRKVWRRFLKQYAWESAECRMNHCPCRQTRQAAGLEVDDPLSEFQRPSLLPFALARLAVQTEAVVEALGITLHHHTSSDILVSVSTVTSLCSHSVL